MEIIKPTFDDIFGENSFSNETKTWIEFCGPRLDNFLDNVDNTKANYEPKSFEFLINQITIELLMANKDMIQEKSIAYNDLRLEIINSSDYYKEMLNKKSIDFNPDKLSDEIQYHMDYIFMNWLQMRSVWDQVKKEYDSHKFKNDLNSNLDVNSDSKKKNIKC